MICLGSLFKEIIVPLYEVFQDDLPGDLRQQQHEVGRRKARWDTMNVAKKHTRRHDSRNQPRPTCTPPSLYWWWCLYRQPRQTRALFQRNAASRQLSALYNDNCALVGADLNACPQDKNIELDAERIIHQFSRQFVFTRIQRTLQYYILYWLMIKSL